MTGSEDRRARLAEEIYRVDWRPLAPHAKRSGLILVDGSLELLEVALAVAGDESVKVRAWMEAQQLRRPSREEIEAWADETEERFTVAIVQPYVLAQRDP